MIGGAPMARGMNTIRFGKIEIMGESVSLSELKETLFEITDKLGYPDSYQKEVSTVGDGADDADVIPGEEDDDLAVELKKEAIAEEEADVEEEEKQESGDEEDDVALPPWAKRRRRK